MVKSIHSFVKHELCVTNGKRVCRTSTVAYVDSLGPYLWGDLSHDDESAFWPVWTMMRWGKVRSILDGLNSLHYPSFFSTLY